jgi:hypothetical protein
MERVKQKSSEGRIEGPTVCEVQRSRENNENELGKEW